MELKHTKGKWWACCMSNKPHFVFAKEICICTPHQEQDFAIDKLSDEEFKANVRLIASAPELLDACMNALAEITNHESGHMNQFQRVYKQLEDVINKATL